MLKTTKTTFIHFTQFPTHKEETLICAPTDHNTFIIKSLFPEYWPLFWGRLNQMEAKPWRRMNPSGRHRRSDSY